MSSQSELPIKVEEKLSEVIMLRLYPSQSERLCRLVTRARGRQDVIRLGLDRELDRIEAEADGACVDPETARLVGEAKRNGLDLRELLVGALERKLSEPAA